MYNKTDVFLFWYSLKYSILIINFSKCPIIDMIYMMVFYFYGMKRVKVIQLIVILFVGCIINSSNLSATQVDHIIWEDLLKKFVTDKGGVNYKALLQERYQLKKYLNVLSNNSPDPSNVPENERLAFWINAYNAFTVDLILEHYPVESINDIGAKIQIPFVNSVFDKKFIYISGKKMSLNDIEHKILRKRFNEPRIHFAIVCASASCPALRKEAYLASRLDSQLDEQAIMFINNPEKNNISKDRVVLSKIFFWFKSDFTDKGSLIDFINQFSEINISPKAKVNFLKYDWSLNEN